MARQAPARVFTIPPGAPFLTTFADALLAGRIVPGFPGDGDPLTLASATIYLPTRRAARALAATLAERLPQRTVLLPDIQPLGDLDAAELALAGEAERAFADAAAHLPPALPPMERRLILTRLVLQWARALDGAILPAEMHEPLLVPASPADALALADDLAALMDGLATEDIPWSSLAGLVEERYSRYYGITLDFVRIAAEMWPAILAERQASDPARRRSALIDAAARRLAAVPPAGPVIVAGSTGSIPATARLIATIARLPQGAVVLPGLDTWLDDDTFALIGAGGNDLTVHNHPQAMLARLLATIGIPRSDVAVLGAPPPALTARARFLSEAMRPAETTDLWAEPAHRLPEADVRAAFEGLTLVEAADEREEALCAAIALREALEDPQATAALVTPDRALAERVAAELARWDIAAEDSAGLPLRRSPHGTLACLVAEAAATNHEPAILASLIAHPLTRFGWPQATMERAARALEIGVLRGPAPPAGLAGIASVLAERREEARDHRAPRPLRRLSDADWDLAATLLERLMGAFSGFSAAEEDECDLVALVTAHRAALEAVTRPAADEPSPLASGEAGEVLAEVFDAAASATVEGLTGRFADYPAFFAALMADAVVRRPMSGHRRVKILGLLEARLVEADRLVLGGLDEEVWPPTARTDAFLNRPMRTALGLAPPERRIGQTAHDFVQALGTRDVVLTRALKRGDAPTVPSRFLQRMQALAGDGLWKELQQRGERLRHWAAALTAPPALRPIERPRPRPDPDLIPRRLSVTEVETLVRDPYAIFARHVLKLDPLDPIAVPPGAADRGTIVHEALGAFTARHPVTLPADALEQLVALGRQAFAPVDAYPDIAALWWPRFLRLAEAFIAWEQERRADIDVVQAEVSGALVLALADGSSFRITARADRIERLRDGRAVIVDFKTGQPPSAKQVFAGFSPQLTLEAAILAASGFRDIAPVPPGLCELLYMHAGGARKPLEPCPVKPPQGETRSVAEIVVEHERKLTNLLSRYVAGEIGFASRPFPQFAGRFGTYDHLARVREWSLAGDDAGGGEFGGEA
ncbi:double-strand break repair protein AddB [Chelatococcus composti]|jgi:double-strand break repair protein AddB, alphaproteobacterial type|uniref:ATP-dependent helicase/nuclease subunit B n=1 Tax=Chelatococcus composti TaxID=1743235 RepID=A0A841K922_9HYPH|nr:double-strand break repair protein AddB [Chelatococcus composti]MBB6167374.1 ATP-dependent helicase/nuclease subunit B [Chelatococcus composti]MBS7735579.1 double-strand break repair protein AddB [Chelatococcus composti]GGG31415.1 double-strand break repair protein AddB [Chelatococcus composti]